MKNLSYQARTNYPTSEDVDRIASQVIGNVSAVCSDSVNQQTAEIMACEIKRRLCDLISVEVDLVVTGASEESEAPPAIPAYMPVLYTAGDMWQSAAENWLLKPFAMGIQMRTPVHIVRGSLPGLI